MSTTLVRYPLDPTGINPDNLIIGEVRQLTLAQVRATAPIYGPFFTDSVVLHDNISNRPLVRGTDYLCADLLQEATLRYGKEIAQIILIINPDVNNEIRMNYQVLGGLYQNNAQAIADMYQSVMTDDRPVDWTNVLNKPPTFPPTLHNHFLQDIYGFESVVVALERIRNAIVLSDVPAFEAFLAYVKQKLQEMLDLLNQTAQDLTDALQAHKDDQGNPHNVTAHQAGTYTSQEIDGIAQQIRSESAGIYFRHDGTVAMTGVVNGARLPLSMAQNNSTGLGSFIARASGTGDGNLAGMTFWNDAYAIKLGVRADGYFGLGGYSRAAWSWYSDPSGNMVAAGNVTAYSDPRLKENIRSILDPIKKLKCLDGVYFTWKDIVHVKLKAGKEDLGLLADQVEKVFPELVYESIELEGKRYKTVAYDKLVPVLIEAIKELSDRVERLEAEKLMK